LKELSDSRVLIVDDAKTNVDILVAALRGECKISVALDGESALKAAAAAPPDLILLDIMMPVLDGYEVLKRLRADPAFREIPVMFISSLEDARDKAKGFELGANEYLTKPFEAVEVKARVRSLLKAKAYSDGVKEKLADELRIAREIQTGILPSDVAATAARAGLEIEAYLEPAREVGGDLYDVLETADGRVVVLVGDVCGKGVPAAIFMAVTTTLARTLARQFAEPDEIIRQVSDSLARHNPQEMFVTLIVAVVEPGGSVSLAGVGHPSPALLVPGRPPSLEAASSAGLAGLEAGLAVSRRKLDLRPGETLLLYSDGVTEAFNAEGEAFGEKRLLAGLASDPGASAAGTVAGLAAALKRFTGAEPQSDDITMVAIRRKA
jgi:sigma-B regulation protein RsbU (phosphoserine phosphatase)